MRKIKVNCKKCGEVEISGHFIDAGEEGFIMPTKLCPTIASLGRYYKDFDGYTYEKNVGNKMSDDFTKEIVELLHTNPDEDGEDWAEHKLEPLECWVLNY